ncbi:putative gustatory receptor 28a [Polyergus mexicanus]|uniref:putative gustatory receptor 28a n=1 Tax=Polyergus mexicanus TaxID=615972 RepID=UPI0038B53EE3
MTKSIRTVLAPFLIISYVSGLRIIEFPVGHPRIWFSLLYMLLFWSIYFLFLKFIITSYFNNKHYTIEYHICIGLDILVTLLSIVFGVYHDKKFRYCLKKLDIIDNTLLNIGTTTDYYKLHKKTIYLILGWLLMIISMSYGTAYWIKNEYNHNTLTAMYALIVRNYCSYINMVNDMIIASIFGYVGLKFDQVNQHLLNLTRDNKRRIKRVWENSTHQHRFSQASSNEWIIWIIIHLHSELRKISREIDTIFGAQMTVKVGCNFFWLALDLRELLAVILINNYVIANKILFTIMILIWLLQNVLKLFFIIYACETVSTKANATGNLINKMSYSTCDVEARENISQLLLQITQSPVKFYGIGLFQYDYKFLYGFSSSITTIVVLLIQSYINKQTF